MRAKCTQETRDNIQFRILYLRNFQKTEVLTYETIILYDVRTVVKPRLPLQKNKA